MFQSNQAFPRYTNLYLSVLLFPSVRTVHTTRLAACHMFIILYPTSGSPWTPRQLQQDKVLWLSPSKEITRCIKNCNLSSTTSH